VPRREPLPRGSPVRLGPGRGWPPQGGEIPPRGQSPAGPGGGPARSRPGRETSPPREAPTGALGPWCRPPRPPDAQGWGRINFLSSAGCAGQQKKKHKSQTQPSSFHDVYPSLFFLRFFFTSVDLRELRDFLGPSSGLVGLTTPWVCAGQTLRLGRECPGEVSRPVRGGSSDDRRPESRPARGRDSAGGRTWGFPRHSGPSRGPELPPASRGTCEFAGFSLGGLRPRRAAVSRGETD
jgi:hypothetical protein